MNANRLEIEKEKKKQETLLKDILLFIT
jgi:hypothetical protein